MHNPFLVTSCLEELWMIKILCVVIAEQNIWLEYIMFGLPTGGKSESLYFIAWADVDYYLCLNYFPKKDK